MTIEIRELVIEARVAADDRQAAPRAARGHADGLSGMSRLEQERLISRITSRVLENLKEQQGGRGYVR